ncbi:methylmalonyl-CoA mutase [Litorimonas cladophorae]|uniref:Methylmalonyl-CoA mutase n=2 Tax=Litorimonas cladophorae TaxID=1220491 RepID=A0A918KJ13_9PROT|nr:methylmalonyl-CoA mutase [Litorimonas cladophorae]
MEDVEPANLTRKHVSMTDLKLKSDFATAKRTEWQKTVTSGLKTGTFEDLIHYSEDGIARGPLMSATDLPPSLAPLARTALPKLEGRKWHITAPVRGIDLNHANTQLLENLKGGASAIRIENGDALKNRNDLKRLLEGVHLDLVPIQFAPKSGNASSLTQALSIAALKETSVWAGLDPIDDEAAINATLRQTPAGWKLMTISACHIHEQGGTDVQELAGLAAHLADAIRVYGTDTVCKHMVIEIASDRDSHLTIAKIRAARRLTRRITEAFDIDGSAIPICAVTSLRMMQTQDAWTNLLRVMSAGFGSVIGGADMITTRPFTDGLGEATPFAHRIARNMQLMMMEESHLGQVADAAHGSYWHEHMTEALAQSAWRAFQMIEQKGGIRSYMDSGEFDTALHASQAARAARSEPLLGITLHPAKNVKDPEVRT